MLHTEGIFKALWWSWMYTVLSVVLWLTFLLRSQGSTLYLSYQQQSDTLSMLLSNNIVGNKSWSTQELRYILDTQADAQMGVLQLVSIRHYRPDKVCSGFHFSFSPCGKKDYHSIIFKMCNDALMIPNKLQWPNRCIYNLSTGIVLEGLGSAHRLIPSVAVPYWQTDRCSQVCNRKSSPSLVKLVVLREVRVTVREWTEVEWQDWLLLQLTEVD